MPTNETRGILRRHSMRLVELTLNSHSLLMRCVLMSCGLLFIQFLLLVIALILGWSSKESGEALHGGDGSFISIVLIATVFVPIFNTLFILGCYKLSYEKVGLAGFLALTAAGIACLQYFAAAYLIPSYVALIVPLAFQYSYSLNRWGAVGALRTTLCTHIVFGMILVGLISIPLLTD